jgi:predicted permease
MHTLGQDIRYGVRTLRKNPGFTTVAVLTLALGIGANTSIFSLINALLLRALPQVKDPQELVLVTDNGWPSLGYPLYAHLRDGSQSLSGLFASPGVGKHRMRIVGSDAVEAERVSAQGVSGNFFSVLGVSADRGRTLTPEDDRPGAPQPVAVISYDFWRRRFGRDPAVLGKVVTLEDVPLTIVGVAPRGFFGFVVGSRPDLWHPIQLVPQVNGWEEPLSAEGDGGEWLQIAGRLKPGVTGTQAREELDLIFKRMRLTQADKQALPEKERQEFLSHRIELLPAATGFTWLRQGTWWGEGVRRLLFTLMAIVILVLLVACTNLAGLLLARGAARQREFSVRTALGARRWALVRQLGAESLLLALAGGGLGLLVAQLGVRVLTNYLPERGAIVHLALRPDPKIFAFTFLISIGTGLLFGLVPAWRSSRLDVATALKDQLAGAWGRESTQFWNKALLVTQIALSCCLLIGAGLFVRTLQKLRARDVGFNREHLFVFELNWPKAYDNTRQADLGAEVLRRLENLPGVRSASMSSIQSLGGDEYGYNPYELALPGADLTAGKPLEVRGTAVAPRYFETMGIPLLLGRDFGPQDEPTAQTDPTGAPPRAIIIDQTSARKLFGDTNPLGKLLQAGSDLSWPPLEVIGVAQDVIHKGLRGGPRFSVYSVPDTQKKDVLHFFYVRTLGSPLAVAGSIRQMVREVDPQVEVTGLHTMKDLVNNQLHRERMLSQLAGFFSLSALALACLGLYGILSYGVTRRTHEIGVRMALGAQRHNVLAAVIRQGMILTLVGCGLGVILALALTRIVSNLLYGVTPTDPLTLALTVLLLGAVALAACYLPARRAARIDPMAALRCE